DGSLLVRKFPIDNFQDTFLDIDVNADYRIHDEPLLDKDGNPIVDGLGNPLSHKVFGNPPDELAYAPISLGGLPGGIAVSNPAPHPAVFQHVANDTGSSAGLVLGVNLAPADPEIADGKVVLDTNGQPRPKLSFGATVVDPLLGKVTPEDGDFYFSVDVTSE